MREAVAPLLSVVVPLYNEEENVVALAARLLPVLRGLNVPFEVLFVDDGSRDRTVEVLAGALAVANEPNVRVIPLARNFGQHAAVCAGFSLSRGSFVVTIDADLQNPPEEIPRLLDEFRKGHDVVGTIRQARQDTLFRRKASHLVNAITRRMSGIQIHDFGCMLRGYSAEIAHAIADRRESKTFVPALGWLYARNPTEIAVAHAARNAGRSKYSLRRLLWLHLDLATGFSVGPLRFLMGLGAAVAGLGVAFGLFLLIMRFAEGPGWAAEGVFTLFAILYIFVGAQFFVLGVVGEYLGRIFMSVRERPAWVLREPAGDIALPAAGAARSVVEQTLAGPIASERTIMTVRSDPRSETHTDVRPTPATPTSSESRPRDSHS
jgi:undecaprenyl-phosphate 4-deoxy-4-formamido-L-arabinose transferase